MSLPTHRRLFASLGLAATLGSAPALAAEDTFDVDPDLQLTCVWGYVSYDYDSMIFSSDTDGGLIVEGVGTHSGALVDLVMTGTMWDDGSFEASQAVLGDCNEHYTLVGQFDDMGDWTGVFSRAFVPSYGGACYDCTDADIDVVGTCTDTSCDFAVVSDSDGDGVDDDDDLCPGTALDVAIDADGCSGTQYVDLVAGEACDYDTHGAYVSAVSQAADDAVDAGLLTSKEKGAIVREAARNKCP